MSQHEVCLAKVRPAEVRVGDVRLAKVRPAEVHPAKVLPTEVRVGEVRPRISMLMPPPIPGIYSLVKKVKMFFVCHV